MEIGHSIAILRTKQGLTQRDLAKILNISAAAVGQWETNKRLPTLDKFVEVADYFSVSADLLLKNDRKVDSKDYINTIDDLIPVIKKAETPSIDLQQADLIRETFLKLSESNKYILMGKAMELLKEESRISKPTSQEKRA